MCGHDRRRENNTKTQAKRGKSPPTPKRTPPLFLPLPNYEGGDEGKKVLSLSSFLAPFDLSTVTSKLIRWQQKEEEEEEEEGGGAFFPPLTQEVTFAQVEGKRRRRDGRSPRNSPTFRIRENPTSIISPFGERIRWKKLFTLFIW